MPAAWTEKDERPYDMFAIRRFARERGVERATAIAGARVHKSSERRGRTKNR